MSIINSSVFVDGQSTITYVEGDQHNHVHTTINQISKESTEYDEYENVIYGRVVMLKEISREDEREHWSDHPLSERLDASTMTCTAEVYPDKQSRFTAVVYEGKDARCLWERDFREFSRVRNADTLQLFGINRSEVPMLIFHRHLTPLAHFCDTQHSLWKSVYIMHLRDALSSLPFSFCGIRDIWMDSRGILCKGPRGPYPDVSQGPSDLEIVVPSTRTMLEGDTAFNFFKQFSSRSLNESVLSCAQQYFLPDYLLFSMMDDLRGERGTHLITSILAWRYQLPMKIILNLRFDAVYSPSVEVIATYPLHHAWVPNLSTGLQEETLVGDKLIRFKLNIRKFSWDLPGRCFILFDNKAVEMAWLSQSSRVADALAMTKQEHHQCLVVVEDMAICLDADLEGDSSCPLFRHDGVEAPPLYIFLRYPPTTISELVSWQNEFQANCYWSFDETGQSRLLECERQKWGIPKLGLFDSMGIPRFHSWPTHIYDALHEWQITRGFNPATTDFAKHMGYPELEVEVVGAKQMFRKMKKRN